MKIGIIDDTGTCCVCTKPWRHYNHRSCAKLHQDAHKLYNDVRIVTFVKLQIQKALLRGV